MARWLNAEWRAEWRERLVRLRDWRGEVRRLLLVREHLPVFAAPRHPAVAGAGVGAVPVGNKLNEAPSPTASRAVPLRRFTQGRLCWDRVVLPPRPGKSHRCRLVWSAFRKRPRCVSLPLNRHSHYSSRFPADDPNSRARKSIPTEFFRRIPPSRSKLRVPAVSPSHFFRPYRPPLISFGVLTDLPSLIYYWNRDFRPSSGVEAPFPPEPA
jgi:hypothetical protein